jgi:small subunit ribosomal protein S6
MTTPLREYELVLLLHPTLSQADAEGFVEDFISEKISPLPGGEVTFQDFWGRKRLAYPIKKEDSAYYVVLNFTSDGTGLTPFDEEIRLDKNILRHLLTTVDKYAEKMTLAEIEAWNTENLPEEKKSAKPEEKRAPRKRRSAPSKAESKSEKPAAKKIDKKELNKKLDEILDTEL